MLTRKRISTERLPPKKRMHRPLHLRKIPSAHIGGTVRVPLDAAPPLLHHPDSDDQLPLQAPAPSSPGVRALRLIHVPRVLVRLPPLPAQLPESSSIAQDYAMDETCFAETSSSMEVSPRGHRKEGNGPDIACKLEEGNLLYGLKKENNERSWENPRISCTIRPSSLQGRVMTSLEAISNSDVIARTRVEKNKLPTSDIERNLEAALSPVVLCLERQAALEMQVMPEILETFEGSGFKDRNPAEARMKQFPKDSHILEPGVRNAPGPRRLKSLEAGSVQGAAIHGKPVKDSLILAARAFATNARMREAKDGSAPIARFEPENIGSYPPRPPNILLFKNALEYIIAFRDLNGLERVEDNDVVALAETEKEPEDYIAQQKFTMNKVQTRFNILLEFFDNPEVDRQHLSIELIMAHKSGKRGVHARSRFFITKSKSFIWAPCLIVDYIPDTDTFVVEWPENHALKNVKRINLILDTENENSFLIRRMNAKELQNRLEDSQRYLAYLEELAFVNPELVNKSLKYRLMQLAGWKISQRYMYVLDDYMKDLKEEYHLVVKKAICDYRFNTSKEEHNKLIAMKIFPQHGTVAPIPHIHNGLANFVYEIGYQFGKLGGPPLHLALSGSYIMAQVQDLAVASPATVSRCGMVYVEPSQIGWWPLITSWLRRMKENFPGIVAALPMIESLLTWLITPCIDFVKKHCRELIPTAAINLAQSLLNLYESMLDEFRIPTGTRASQRASQIGGIVLFTPPTGSDVDIWIQLLALEDDLGFELPAGQVIIKPKFKMALPYPEAGSVYNYCFWKLEQVWKDWIQTVDTRPPAMTAPYNDIIVPTVDTARYSFLLIVLVQHQKHVLFGGPTGTGNLGLFMDAGTAIIDSKLDKRKRGVYGPYPEEKCVIFVDDLNMPALETYGAQPPIEILRQWMDHGGWYDREDNTFHQLINIQFVAAMGPPGGGHNSVTPRYMRHYNVLSILDFDNASLTVVFTIIVDWWARKTRFPHDVVLKKAGAENTPTVFIFSDTQLKLQQFLEDINNILNTGEVPNLYPKDEIVPLLDMIRTRAKKAGKDGSIAELYMYFIELCRTNLHMVMCMSPFGDNFRTRLRMFPSLVNCCTIDWFSEWPEEALRSVATNFVASIDIDKSLQEPVRDMCMLFHQHAATLAVTFLQEAQRFIYVTPTSYLELLATYKDLLQKKWKEIDSIRTRYKMGLEKLYFAESQVTVMKESLVALQPILIKTAEDTNMLLKAIDAETKDAQATCSIVETEEAAAHVKAMEAKAIKDECEGELAVAMPMLEAALAALDTLTKADITEVKAMKNPPATVKLVMEACCIMKGVKSRRIPDPNKPGSKMEDFWGPTQQMLADSGFLTSLKTYDKDNMPAALMEKIHPYISNPNFEPAVVLKASKAAYGLCCWVRAMESYDKVNKIVAPKKAKLAAATMEFEGLQAALALKKEFLKAIEDKLAGLQEQLDKKGEEKAALEREVLNCKNKLARASQLINGLGGEKVRWTKVQADMSVVYQNLLGDVLLSSGYIAYLGAVNLGYRQTALKHWEKVCREKNVPCSDDFSLANVLGNPVTIRNWVIDGLPNDSFSVDNAIIMSVARRWPLLIDPQGQANNWIWNKEKKFNLQTMKLSDSDFVRKLESCIQFGFPLLLENVLEELDPTLEPLLIKAIFKSGGSLQIRLGDNTIEYNKKFRFYITTKLRNPHYFPEVAVKVTLLNFMITPEGLEDQLLGEVVKHERPDLEEEKTQLVIRGAENARQLSETEDQIILVLSSAEGNILEDETAINNISSSKALSVEIAEKQKTAVVTEAKIDVAHQGYIPVAKHVSALFFMISELCNVDPMYQYSLSWYLQLFISGMEASNKSADLDTRISTLNDFFTYLLYCNVARSLFQKDKLLLTFSICITNLRGQGKLDIEEWNFLLSGAVSTEKTTKANPSAWLSDKLWNEMVQLSKLASFVGLERSFTEDASSWSHFYASQEPYYEDLPAEWAEKLSNFQMLLVVRVLRPDKLVGAVSGFLLDAMGQRYVEPPGFDLTSAYGDSDALTPLIFILSAGSDPMAALLKFSEEGKHVVNTISLGQGQGPKAALLIQSALRTGDWVVLQNCHLAPSWMPSLERICENFTPEGTNISFRLWLTSYPSDQFPVAILQNGVKMTNEAPKGLRANMLQSYLTYPISDPEFFHMGGEMGVSWRKMVFGLCFFHASVQERVKFGPLGWNIPYQFSDPDLKISLRQLQSFLLEFPDSVPFKAFVYLTGECNYGGRVTDAHDRRTLVSILSVIYQPNILHDSYSLSNSGAYLVPKDCEYQDYIEHIKRFPLIAMPEAFGLHQNADITKDNQEVNQPLTAILSTQSQSRIAGGRSREELLLDIVMDMNKRLPPPFNLELARYKYPVQYEESMNSVLVQEMVRFNCLTDVIRASLATLQKALKGLVVMSSDIETLAKNMFTSKMPVLWAPVSYPTMKPLSSYFNDLMDRLNMLQKQGDHEKRPEDGVYIYGMFLEGARWDNEHMMLAESFDKVLHSNAPMLWLLPTEMSKKIVQACYMCPLYRTTERRGVLATTGHSSNFVFNVELPTKASPDHWICRGVAMLLSLSD
ncbi:unnamed protein product [Sphagnum troendelagicum]|uniref:Dynein heavy chain n=1 Tax=Sphagnum troendelagicum TaxID=128251 RepID=A0ABP0USS3_9BRYO